MWKSRTLVLLSILSNPYPGDQSRSMVLVYVYRGTSPAPWVSVLTRVSDNSASSILRAFSTLDFQCLLKDRDSSHMTQPPRMFFPSSLPSTIIQYLNLLLFSAPGEGSIFLPPLRLLPLPSALPLSCLLFPLQSQMTPFMSST